MRQLVIRTSVANLHKEPSFKSEMVTQAILWEKVEFLESDQEWFKVRQWDGYESWVHQFYTVQTEKRNKIDEVKINRRYANIYNGKNTSSDIISEAVFGTILPVQFSEKYLNQILLPDSRSGWIEKQEAQKNVSIREQIVYNALQLRGIQYLWGGKTSKGFDCSGFIQTVFKFCSIELPRDASQQINISGLKKISLESAEQGDLLFFMSEDQIDHVGISLGNGKMIHCSGDVHIVSLDLKDKDNDDMLVSKFHSALAINSLIEVIS